MEKYVGLSEHEIENTFKEWEKRVHPDDLEEQVYKRYLLTWKEK